MTKTTRKGKKAALLPKPRTRRKADELPKLKRHPTGQAYAYFGRYVYFGSWDDQETARALYSEACRQYRDNGDELPPDWESNIAAATPTPADIDDLAADYLVAMRAEFDRRGDAGNQFADCRRAAKVMSELFGDLPCGALRKQHLIQLRDHLQSQPGRGGQSHPTAQYVSRRLTAVKRMLAWSHEADRHGLPATLLIEFDQMKRPKAGVSKLRASEGKPKADLTLVEEVIAAPTTTRIVRDMLLFQLATGARPEEVCRVCPGELTPAAEYGQEKNADAYRRLLQLPAAADATPDVTGYWVWEPVAHKNKDRGKHRFITVSPEAYRHIAPYMNRPKRKPCFSPIENYREVQQSRASVGGKPATSEHFTCATYHKAVFRACLHAFPYPPELQRMPGERDSDWRQRTGQRRLDFEREFCFSPIQIRKAGLTEVLRIAGREIAARQGGHDERTSPRYAQHEVSAVIAAYRRWGASK